MSLYEIPNITTVPELLNKTNYFVCANVNDPSTCGGLLGGFILFGIFIAMFVGQKFAYPSERAFLNSSFLVMILSLFFWIINFVKFEAVVITSILFFISAFLIGGRPEW